MHACLTVEQSRRASFEESENEDEVIPAAAKWFQTTHRLHDLGKSIARHFELLAFFYEVNRLKSPLAASCSIAILSVSLYL